MENVEGLLTAQESEYIAEAARKFVEAGYTNPYLQTVFALVWTSPEAEAGVYRRKFWWG
jgi:site-specific DNA-cytosine methylase